MQRRAALWIFGLVLTFGFAALGCQFIAGVAGLEAVGGSGGGGGGSGGSGGKTYGDSCVENDECPSGFCTEGICCKVEECGLYACDSTGEECATGCIEALGGCASDAFCDQPPQAQAGKCESCGWAPIAGTCPAADCDTCVGNLCTTMCDEPDECSANLTIETEAGASRRFLCGDQCNNITIKCSGPFPCEVVCGAGGCQNLILKCDRIGQCALTCESGGCAGASILCGGNRCTATCQEQTLVDQTCNKSCDCATAGCL